MRYTFFKAKNFKGIQDTRLVLPDRDSASFIPLVGLNESGKTTVLEAINSFTYGADDLADLNMTGYARPDVHDLIPINQRANFNDSVEITVGVELDAEFLDKLAAHLLEEHDFKLDSKPRTFSITEKVAFVKSKHDTNKTKKYWTIGISGRVGKSRKTRDFSTSSDIWQSAVKYIGSSLPRIWYFPNFLFEFPQSVYLSDIKDRSEAFNNRHRFYRRVFQSVLDELDLDGATLNEHVLERARSDDPNDRRALKSLLQKMSQKLTDDVFSAWGKIFEKPTSDVKVVLETEQDESGHWVLAVFIQDGDGSFSLGERSLGFRWFFVFLLVTHYATPRGSQSKQNVFLFDEPASNLHPTAQQRLLGILEKLSTKYVVIYTTHSHHLVSPRHLGSTYVVQNASENYDFQSPKLKHRPADIKVEKYRTFASRHSQHTGYYQPVLDALDYRPSNLEFVQPAVLLEGKADYYLLRLLADCFMESPLPFHLVPGSGAGSFDALIQLYLGWSREFVIVLDSDSEGKLQKSRYIERFGKLVDSRVVLLGELQHGAKAAESLLSTEDSEAIVGSVFPDADVSKKKLLAAAQELVATRSSPVWKGDAGLRARSVFSTLEQRIRATT